MADFDAEYELLFKAVLTGDTAVGKSNLMSRIAKNEFTHNSKPTIGVEFATRSVVIQGRSIKAQLWDTAGQERYRAITSAYYRGALGAFLVYDITERSSFENLEKWLKDLRENGDPEMVVILVGNKSDLNEHRQVDLEEGRQLAEEESLCFMETSAKDNVNVEEAFMEMITRIHTVTRQKQLASKSFKAMHSLQGGREILHLDDQVTPVKQSKCCTN